MGVEGLSGIPLSFSPLVCSTFFRCVVLSLCKVPFRSPSSQPVNHVFSLLLLTSLISLPNLLRWALHNVSFRNNVGNSACNGRLPRSFVNSRH